MKIKTKNITRVIYSSLLLANSVFATEFYASNNTKEISLQNAYTRLTHAQQNDLQNTMITVFQKNHIEQGEFQNLLGTYRMSKDQKITADNSEVFSTSPSQRLSQKIVFSLARELAKTLKQDSVAVFIPQPNKLIGEITVTFKSHKPGIRETVDLLHKKLTSSYNQAFSLYLDNTCGEFNQARVTKIEWLGSKINMSEIKKSFPHEEVSSRFGKVFLVYQHGDPQSL